MDSHRPAPLRFAGRRDTTANDPKGCGIRASVLVVPVVVAYVKMQSDQNTPSPPSQKTPAAVLPAACEKPLDEDGRC